MMNILYLLPPSEGKNSWGKSAAESCIYTFEKPCSLALGATQKDLKCSGKRYEEGKKWNTQLCQTPKSVEVLPAIERYSGVMYNAIDYEWMGENAKAYFRKHFLILSGMYGILCPWDMIGNYKLPIETKWLRQFWETSVTDALNQLHPDVIVDFLPGSYAKMIQWENLSARVIRVNFLHTKDGVTKKMTHGVKKVKGEYIKQLCEAGGINIGDLWKEQGKIDIRR